MTNPKLVIGRSTFSLSAVFLALALGLPQTSHAILICDGIPHAASAYFPLPDGASWTYTNDKTATVVAGTTTINGAVTRQVQDEVDNARFYTNNSNGLKLHRDQFFSNPGYDIETFQPPIDLLGAEFCAGQQIESGGKADVTIYGFGSNTMNYSATTSVVGAELVTVPAGTFNAVKVVSTRHISGFLIPDVIYLSYNRTLTLWLVKGIGIVKEIVTEGDPPSDTVYELTSTTLGGGCNVIIGTAADDTIEGTARNDCINGKGGVDSMSGLAGNDTYTVNNADDTVIEGAGEGTDTIKSSVTYTLPIYVEKLVLTGTGNTKGKGNGLANRITGNGGNNTLNGRSGNDTLVGGAGGDKFLFNSALNGVTNVDRLMDFVPTEDKILLENSVFTVLDPGSLPPSAFHVGFGPVTAAHRIIYDPTTGHVYYDPDGRAASGEAMLRFATLTNKPTLTYADFVVQ